MGQSSATSSMLQFSPTAHSTAADAARVHELDTLVEDRRQKRRCALWRWPRWTTPPGPAGRAFRSSTDTRRGRQYPPTPSLRKSTLIKLARGRPRPHRDPRSPYRPDNRPFDGWRVPKFAATPVACRVHSVLSFRLFVDGQDRGPSPSTAQHRSRLARLDHHRRNPLRPSGAPAMAVDSPAR